MTWSERVRVLFAEDESVMRALLKESFFAHAQVDVVGLAKSAEEVMDLVRARNPHIVVIDSRLRGCDTAHIVTQVRSYDDELFIIAFTTEALIGLAQAHKMVECGANVIAFKPKAVGAPDAALQFLQQSLTPLLLERLSNPV